MKGKKVLKILVAAIMVTTFIAQVVAMADAASYTTQTTYDLSGKAQVTTSVSGVDEGEEVTFLVKDSSSNILYIDQTTAVSGTTNASFTFLTPIANANAGATVEVGTSSTGKLADPGNPNNTIVLSSGTVTYSVEGNGEVYVGEAAIAQSGGSETAYNGQYVYFYFAPDVGYEISTVKIDDNAATNISGYQYSYPVNGNASLVFTFAATSSSETPTIVKENAPATGAYAAVYKDDEKTAMTSFASITNVNAASEFGIIVSKDRASLEAVTNADAYGSVITKADANDNYAIYRFPAAASVGGKFGVQLIDGGIDYLNGTVYSRSYVKYGNDYSFGTTVEHTY